MSEWQDISTAPKDGTDILVFCPENSAYLESIETTYYDTQLGWVDQSGESSLGDSYYSEPSHWMPLPTPPA